MQTVPFATIKQKLQTDLDIQDEDWIDSGTELLGYINEGIEDIEGEIHELGIEQKYFKARAQLTLTANQNAVPLPADLFGWKIIELWYQEPSTGLWYEVKKFKNEREYLEAQPGDTFKYLLDNDAANGPRILVGPAPAANGAIHCVYVRHARKLTANAADPANNCDIPESVNYLYALVKLNVKEKAGTPDYATASKRVEAQRELTIQKLSNQTADKDDTLVQLDASSYEDQLIYVEGRYR